MKFYFHCYEALRMWALSFVLSAYGVSLQVGPLLFSFFWKEPF